MLEKKLKTDGTNTEGQQSGHDTRRQGLCLMAHRGSQPLRALPRDTDFSRGFLLELENSLIRNGTGPPSWQPWYPWISMVSMMSGAVLLKGWE